MLLRTEQRFYDLIMGMTSPAFLNRVAESYHYLPENLPELLPVAREMQKFILEEAFLETDKESEVPGKRGKQKAVVITLGAGVDRLQDAYSEKGKLTESYMIEALGNELLLHTYRVWNDFVEAKTEYHVAKYIFMGSSEEYPLEKLPEFLARVSDKVLCNEHFLMIPKKSVAFYTVFTKDGKVRCEGICQSCGRRDCQNRAKKERLLPYGYARILGRNFE